MTDTEINRRLALAIGYRPEDMRQTLGRMVIVNRPVEVEAELWVEFDHTEWGTISPIAEKFDLFPVRLTDGKCSRVVCGPAPAFLLTDIIESTPQRCIALAALCALERK